MKIVDYESLKRFKARVDAAFASKAEINALAGDVDEIKKKVGDVEASLTWQ